MNSEERLHCTYAAWLDMKAMYHRNHDVNSDVLAQMDTIDAMLQSTISHLEDTQMEMKL